MCLQQKLSEVRNEIHKLHFKTNSWSGRNHNNKMSYSVPEGGTGYATVRGILLNKPTYIFNQSDKYGNEIGWYKWDNNVKDFVKTDVPILSKNFTGIGSQEINELGLQAIRDVYENSLKDKGNSSKTKLNNIKVSAISKYFTTSSTMFNSIIFVISSEVMERLFSSCMIISNRTLS